MSLEDLMEEDFSNFETEGPLHIQFEHKSKDYNIHNLRPDSTCEDLIKEIGKLINGVNNQGDVNKAFTYRVECHGATLIGKKKLSEFGLTGGLVFIQVFVHANAGSLLNKEKTKTDVKLDIKTRNITFKDHKQINKVWGKCIMFGDKDEHCAKMKCGCLVSPLGMRKIIQWILHKRGLPLIYCPTCDLNKKKYIYWSYKKCLHIANITGDNYKIIATVFHNRFQIISGVFKNCPNCFVKNKKAPGVLEYRIHCSSCKKDFCFRCTKPWIKSGMILCGNRKCPTYEKQRILLECPVLSTDNNRSWVARYKDQIPEKRACPKCLNLMSHALDCAHMCCTACGYDFCWICLESWKKENHLPWSCQLKARQKLN